MQRAFIISLYASTSALTHTHTQSYSYFPHFAGTASTPVSAGHHGATAPRDYDLRVPLRAGRSQHAALDCCLPLFYATLHIDAIVNSARGCERHVASQTAFQCALQGRCIQPLPLRSGQFLAHFSFRFVSGYTAAFVRVYVRMANVIMRLDTNVRPSSWSGYLH